MFRKEYIFLKGPKQYLLVKWTCAICSEYMIILRNVLELVILEYAFAIQSNDNESLIF